MYSKEKEACPQYVLKCFSPLHVFVLSLFNFDLKNGRLFAFVILSEYDLIIFVYESLIAIFDVLTRMLLKVQDFWDVTLCSWGYSFRYFQGSCHLNLLGQVIKIVRS
jgi:hypothetical protein